MWFGFGSQVCARSTAHSLGKSQVMDWRSFSVSRLLYGSSLMRDNSNRTARCRETPLHTFFHVPVFGSASSTVRKFVRVGISMSVERSSHSWWRLGLVTKLCGTDHRGDMEVVKLPWKGTAMTHSLHSVQEELQKLQDSQCGRVD